MSKRYKFVVYLPPKGAARPRASAASGNVVVYGDKATENWKATVSYVAAKALPKEILEGNIANIVLAIMPRPKRFCERRKDGTLKCGEEGLIWAPVKPDEDNIKKAVYDGLNACWRDDANVVSSVFKKCYAEIDGRPRVIVEVWNEEESVPEYVKAFAADSR